MSWQMTLPNTPAPARLIECSYCREMVNPKGGMTWGLRFICSACLKRRGIK